MADMWRLEGYENVTAYKIMLLSLSIKQSCSKTALIPRSAFSPNVKWRLLAEQTFLDVFISH